MKKIQKMTKNDQKKLKFLIEWKSWKTKMSKLEKWWKWENWNEAVWDAIAGKNVLNSWDRAPSIDHVKWSVRAQYNWKKVTMFFDFGTVLSTCYCWRLIFWCFSFRRGFEKLKFVLANQFSSKFWSQTFFCHFRQFLWKMKEWDLPKSEEKK